MKKIDNTWIKYLVIMFLIFILGLIGLLITYDNTKWSFIFENIMWLPIELGFTVFAINKVLELIQEKRNHGKFIRITGDQTKYLIEAIKENIVHIAVNCQVHDPNRNEENIYDKILKSPIEYFNSDLFSSNREYLISHNPIVKKNYNYTGITYIHCKKLDKRLTEYIDQFYFYFDDQLFKEVNDFKTLNHGFGNLSQPSILNDTFDKYIIAPESYEYLQKQALNYIKEAEQLISLLEEYG